MHLSSEREDEAARATLGGGAENAPRLCRSVLKRPEGATVEQIAEAMGWAPRHTVRGAMAGALKKELGLTITPEKIDGRRVYRIVE